MDNQIFGSITIAFCVIGYFFSWKYYSKNNFKVAIFLLTICGLALRIFTSLDFFLNTWDERYHALVAKNLLNHPLIPTLYDHPILHYNFNDWTSNHVWLHKPPLPLYTISLSFWLFGTNEIALRLPSIVFTSIGITLIYSIGKYFINRKAGYFAAFLYSINGLIIEMTAGRVATDHIDIFFLFFIQLAIFLSIQFAQKKKAVFNILAGVTIGCAILSKWLPALIVLPIWLLIAIESKKFTSKELLTHFIILIVVIVCVSLPWQLYIFTAFPNEAFWEISYNFKHITDVLDERGGPIYYYLNKIRVNYGELIYLPLAYFLWKTGKNIKNLKRVAICIWFIIPLIFFTYVKTKMQAFILFSAPALFLMTADFWYMLSERKLIVKTKWAISFLMFLFIAIPVRYAIERIKPFEKRDRNPQWVSDLKKSKDELNKNTVLFNYPKPIEAMFYTDATVYDEIPDDSTLKKIQDMGIKIIINDNGKLPAKFLTNQYALINLTTSIDK